MKKVRKKDRDALASSKQSSKQPKQPQLQTYPKLKMHLLKTGSEEPIQNCALTGPLNFDSSLISLLELVPNQIHVAPIVAIDFSMGNL